MFEYVFGAFLLKHRKRFETVLNFRWICTNLFQNVFICFKSMPLRLFANALLLYF